MPEGSMECPLTAPWLSLLSRVGFAPGSNSGWGINYGSHDPMSLASHDLA